MTPGTERELAVTERTAAALRLDAGLPLFVLYGPGVGDRFVGRDYQCRTVEQELWELLRTAGFERIVFSRLDMPIYFCDAGSRPGRQAARQAGRQATRLRHFRSRLKQERYLPDGTASVSAGAALAPPETGGAPMIDELAVQTLDAWMRQPRSRTALVVVHAEEWLAFLRSSGKLALAFADWISAGHDHASVCVLLFNSRAAGPVVEFLTALGRPVPSLRAYIDASQEPGGGRHGGVVRLGEPEAPELDRCVQLARLRHGLRVDWLERERLAFAMAAERRSAGQWLRVLDKIGEERVPLTGEELRRRGHLTTAVSDGRSARERLDGLVGLEPIKRHLVRLHALAKDEAERRGRGGPGREAAALHLVMRGNPGTGKTVVAGLIGELYRDAGLLRRGHVHAVKVADLVSPWVGNTPTVTNEAIDRALDGVLFIDEAYRLTSQSADNHSRQAVDTLLDRMENERARLVVIVAGYPAEMDEFLTANPGLASRFPERNRVDFPDYDPAELLTILEGFLRAEGIAWTPATQRCLKQVTAGLHRTRKPDFGNARVMRELASELIAQRALRREEQGLAADEPLLPEDLPERLRVHLHRPTPPLAELLAELNALVGLSAVKQAIEALVHVLNARRRQRQARPDGVTAVSPPVAPHLLFTGPPGTGKTTVARLMARVYHALGLLPTDTCVEVTPANLVGQYLGHSERNTLDAADRARGGVLFIDEAHNLTPHRGEGADYHREVIATLVPLLENRRGQFAVIAAGYGPQMQQLLRADDGLEGRFEQRIPFERYDEAELVEILRRLGAAAGYTFAPGTLERAGSVLEAQRQSNPAGFANARDVRRLFGRMEARLSARIVALPPDCDPALLFHFEPQDVPSEEPLAPSAGAPDRRGFDLVSRLPAPAPALSRPQLRAALGFVTVVSADGDEGTGSGFVVTPDGLFVTARHVIDGGRSITVRVEGLGEEAVPAEAVGWDAEADLAVLRLAPGDYPWMPLAGQDWAPEEGMAVSAYGFPYGEQLGREPSFTQGRITSVRRREPDGVARIQLDAVLAPGTSGGPVFTDDHRVVGVIQGGLRPDLGSGFNRAVEAAELRRRFGPAGGPLGLAKMQPA